MLPGIKFGAISQRARVVHGQHVSTFRLDVTNLRRADNINFQFILAFLTTADHGQEAEKAKEKRRDFDHRVQHSHSHSYSS